MRTSTRLLALATLALTAPCVSQAAIVLYDGTLPVALGTGDGNSSSSYDPINKYALGAYNTGAVTYNEIGTSDKYLQFSNNGGRDAVLRYSFIPSQVQNYANAATPADKLLIDIAANPVLSFDIAFTGRQTATTWAIVYINIESQTTGVASRDLFAQTLVFGETANVTFNFADTPAGVVGSAYTGSAGWSTWLDAMGATTEELKTSQLRITVQTGGVGDTGGTFTIDNIQLAAVPEPSTFAALGGIAVLGLATLRRRRC